MKNIEKHYERKLSVTLRAMNALITFVERVRGKHLFLLSKEAAIKAAVKKTGLMDFAGDDVEELLEFLCSTQVEPLQTPWGRLMRGQAIIKLLSDRLHIVDTIKKNPAILNTNVSRPWFILGLPRTGTTLLHRLLAQDIGHRAPLTWELMNFYPIPAKKHLRRDPRIVAVEGILRVLNRFNPELRSIHEIEAEYPEECHFIMGFGLVTGAWPDLLSERSWNWVQAQNLTKTYELHKAHLQILQYGSAAKTWVLKSPMHLFSLDSLLNIYPDARIVQTHRNPGDVLASVASLYTMELRSRYDDVDLHDVGRRVCQRSALMLNKGLKSRDEAMAREGTKQLFVDICYSDLIKDPIESIRKIYSTFEVALTQDTIDRMKAYLDSNKQNKFGKHHYSSEDFGLDDGVVRQSFAAYSERFLQ